MRSSDYVWLHVQKFPPFLQLLVYRGVDNQSDYNLQDSGARGILWVVWTEAMLK